MELGQFSLAISKRRLAGIAATVLAHAVMIFAWLATRQAPLLDGVKPPSVLWVRLPEHMPVTRAPSKSADDQPRVPVADGTGVRASVARNPRPEWATPRSAGVDVPDATFLPALTARGLDATPRGEAPTVISHPLLDEAKRTVGAIDRALRKENNAYIVAPLDSPQIRMRKKMEEAAVLAPKHFWEAPKIEEVVNDSGDGTRRTRVTTGGRTYCITERSFSTSIDMTEEHGNQMITGCSRDNEKPIGNTQEWRTARD